MQSKNLLDNFLCENIELIFHRLKLDFELCGTKYVGCCPIHGGDNENGCVIYPSGERMCGYWRCHTHGCEKIFRPTIIGFIRGLISTKLYHWTRYNEQMATFPETIEIIGKICTYIEKNKDSIIYKRQKTHVKKTLQNKLYTLSREQVRERLEIPAPYFLKRGFSQEILDKYDVGTCMNKESAMKYRTVVPVYNYKGNNLVGCQGRSIFEKCPECKLFHHIKSPCPEKKLKHLYFKWRNSKGFYTTEHLYNLWFAKDFIRDTKTTILVESMGNVWRLEEAGYHNSVGLFGINFDIKQHMLLSKLDVRNLIIIFDNDEHKAGQHGAEKIYNDYKNYFNSIDIIVPPKKDVGEMSIEEVRKML